MELFTRLDQLPESFGPSAVTVGKFDGVHIGHREMVEQLKREATARSLLPVVLTFDRNPLSLLAPQSCPSPLVSNQQKLEVLESLGVAATLMLTFDKALSELPAEEFALAVLAGALNAKLIFVGADFRFGKGGIGTTGLLTQLGKEHGVEVRQLSTVERNGRRVSSTWVRDLLMAGDVAGAAELLGRPAVVRGTVVRGAQRGRELGFPTANLDQAVQGFIPADGVYAAWAVVDGEPMPAAVSIGNNPTFDGVPPKQVEAHLLDRDIDLYGRTLELAFVERIRGMTKFDGIDALVEGITRDVDDVRRILESQHARVSE